MRKRFQQQHLREEQHFHQWGETSGLFRKMEKEELLIMKNLPHLRRKNLSLSLKHLKIPISSKINKTLRYSKERNLKTLMKFLTLSKTKY